jgi:hypothetical protein
MLKFLTFLPIFLFIYSFFKIFKEFYIYKITISFKYFETDKDVL